MKLSFSLPPKSSKPATARLISDENAASAVEDEYVVKEFVTEFDPSKTLSNAKPKYVIPPIDDRRRIHKEIEFESEIPSDDASISDKNITYGLNLRQKVPRTEQLLLKSLRNDMKSLPDAPALEDFESVPVEGFGAALLAGYGWKPGQGIGLKGKEDVKIVEYNKWSGTEGFGFNPRVRGKGEEEEEARTNLVRETGLKRKNLENVEKYRKVRGREKVSWLRSHIRVRIISKEFKNGRLYLKKGVVTDVVGVTTCDITMDETLELVQGIDQELLETALPRRGGNVLVLSGRYKGVYGSLVEKDLDKESGVVCDADSKEMVHVKLDEVAEYVGDPDGIGY